VELQRFTAHGEGRMKETDRRGQDEKKPGRLEGSPAT